MLERLQILHIEDSERDFELIQGMIATAGYEVHGHRVDDKEAMTAALADQSWDIVLSDYSIPGFDSFAALQLLRQYDADTPFIVVSGTVGEETAVRLMRAGAADYVMKDNMARLPPAILRELADVEHRRARRHAEARLRDRERMLSAAQRVARLGSWEMQLPAGSVSWSEEVSAIVGGDPPEGAQDLRFFINAVHPDDRETVEQIISAAMISGDMLECEHRVIRLDGSERWLLLQVGSEKDDQDYPVRMVGTLLDITERKQADQALRESERRYRLLLEQAADGIVVINSRGRVAMVNTCVCDMLGYTADEFVGRRVEQFLGPGELRERPLRVGQLRGGVTLRNERLLRCKDGTLVPTETSSRVLDDGSVQIIIRDITERRQAEAALRQSEQEYRNLFENANDAVIIFDPERERVVDVNPRACELYGIAHDDFAGRSLRDLAGWLATEDSIDLVQLLMREVQGHEIVLTRPDGAPLHLTVSASAVEFRGRNCVLSIQRDITDQKRLEEQLRHQALHDSLTGLANRALFRDRLEHALARARADSHDVAVLMLDLDRFKVINESLGHDVGDRMLVGVAERLLECVREGDTVARLGGDEFTILIEGVTNMREVTMVAERVRNMLHMPIALDSHDIVVTGSIGIVIAELGRGTPDGIMRDADVAMYRAKDDGRGGYTIFDPSMNATMLERLELESDLRRAIERGELRIHYQPTVAMRTGRVVGMEALIRWLHPKRGLLEPAAFIPLAEEAGLIRAVDQWVLESACRQLADWMRQHNEQPFIINVNVSAQSFQHPDMVHDVAAALENSGVAADQLQLEITESVVMTDAGATHSRLRQLKELGVRLAIDDFGTGYSSLSYLKRFPVDMLKVDRSFVDGLDSDDDDTVIVRAVISMAHALGLLVIAEGVESETAANQLLEFGCELCQGFYYAEPLPAEAFESLWAGGLQIDTDWRTRRAS